MATVDRSTCAKCNRVVYAMEAVSVDGKTFHKSCFKCAFCKKQLAASFVSYKGNFYCAAHKPKDQPDQMFVKLKESFSKQKINLPESPAPEISPPSSLSQNPASDLEPPKSPKNRFSGMFVKQTDAQTSDKQSDSKFGKLIRTISGTIKQSTADPQSPQSPRNKRSSTINSFFSRPSHESPEQPSPPSKQSAEIMQTNSQNLQQTASENNIQTKSDSKSEIILSSNHSIDQIPLQQSQPVSDQPQNNSRDSPQPAKDPHNQSNLPHPPQRPAGPRAPKSRHAHSNLDQQKDAFLSNFKSWHSKSNITPNKVADVLSAFESKAKESQESDQIPPIVRSNSNRSAVTIFTSDSSGAPNNASSSNPSGKILSGSSSSGFENPQFSNLSSGSSNPSANLPSGSANANPPSLRAKTSSINLSNGNVFTSAPNQPPSNTGTSILSIDTNSINLPQEKLRAISASNILPNSPNLPRKVTNTSVSVDMLAPAPPSVPPKRPMAGRSYKATVSASNLQPSPISLPPDRPIISQESESSASKPATLNDLQQRIKSLIHDILSLYDRIKLLPLEQRKTMISDITTTFSNLRDTLRQFIDQTSSIVTVIDLRRSGIELIKHEKELIHEMMNGFGNNTPSRLNMNDLKHVLSSIHANVEIVMRKYPQSQSKYLVKSVPGYSDESSYEPNTVLDNQSNMSVASDTLNLYRDYVLEHVPDALYYRNHFMGQNHVTYIGVMEKLGPVIISLKKEEPGTIIHSPVASGISDRDDTTYKDIEKLYRAILRIRDQPERRDVIHSSQLKKTILGKPTTKSILQHLHKDIVPSKLKLIEDKNIESRLLTLDELRYCIRYKIGVIVMKPGQCTDNAYFGNKDAGASYHRFLGILGDTISLSGWKGYNGGLDTVHGRTGAESVYTCWRGMEIMFHVSTMLPWVEGDDQQIDRKRHVGNDIVNIVYMDSDANDNGPLVFDPLSIRSQFTHVFIVVKEEPSAGVDPATQTSAPCYHVSVVSNTDVPKFGPPLPSPPVFTNPTTLRDFLLCKLVNAENASYKAPKFAKPYARTYGTVFDDIIGEYHGGSSSTNSGGISSRRMSKNSFLSSSSSANLTNSTNNLSGGNSSGMSDWFRLRGTGGQPTTPPSSSQPTSRSNTTSPASNNPSAAFSPLTSPLMSPTENQITNTTMRVSATNMSNTTNSIQSTTSAMFPSDPSPQNTVCSATDPNAPTAPNSLNLMIRMNTPGGRNAPVLDTPIDDDELNDMISNHNDKSGAIPSPNLKQQYSLSKRAMSITSTGSQNAGSVSGAPKSPKSPGSIEDEIPVFELTLQQQSLQPLSTKPTKSSHKDTSTTDPSVLSTDDASLWLLADSMMDMYLPTLTTDNVLKDTNNNVELNLVKPATANTTSIPSETVSNNVGNTYQITHDEADATKDMSHLPRSVMKSLKQRSDQDDLKIDEMQLRSGKAIKSVSNQ